jgi:hypothetical protein
LSPKRLVLYFIVKGGKICERILKLEISRAWEYREKNYIIVETFLEKIDEKEMLADLIAAAYNSAKKQSTEASNNKMKDLTGGLGLPSGFKIPGLF